MHENHASIVALHRLKTFFKKSADTFASTQYFSDRCRSRLHTCTLTNVILKTPTEHTCKVDGTTLQLRIFKGRVVHRALSTQETPDTIITSCYRGKNKSFFFSNIFFLLIARYVRSFY